MIAAILLVAGAAIAAKLVIDLGALTVELVPGRPTSLPSLTPVGADLGRPVTLEEAADIAGFTPFVPAALGPPDRVWVDEAMTSFETSDRSVRLVMAWRPNADLPQIPGTRWGAVLMEFDGEANVATKIVYAETGSLRRALVDGRSAFWTTGHHELDLLGPDGLRRYLVTGNVLLWDEAGLTARLETALGKHAAIADRRVDLTSGTGEPDGRCSRGRTSVRKGLAMKKVLRAMFVATLVLASVVFLGELGIGRRRLLPRDRSIRRHRRHRCDDRQLLRGDGAARRSWDEGDVGERRLLHPHGHRRRRDLG